MQWYYSKNGTQLGPIDDGALRAKLASGEVSPTDLVWKDGMTDWLPASRVAELSSQLTRPQGNSPIPPALGDAGQSPYTPPVTQPGAISNFGPHVPNYLWQAIVVTVFCCLPFGIPAIVYAAKVDTLKAQGDMAGAVAASSSAKMWCMVSAGIGLGVGLLWFVAVFFAAATSQ